jgi:hypothetical protein
MSSRTCYSENNEKQYGWGNCYNASNNYDFNSPAKMADGRLWSQWSPDAVVNNRIQQKEGIQSNWQYRQYLQNNGLQVMNYNSMESCYTLGIDPHVKSDRTPSDNVPYKFKNTFDTSKPGFGYCNSDLKNPYLTAEQLNARLISPSINPENYKNIVPGVKM